MLLNLVGVPLVAGIGVYLLTQTPKAIRFGGLLIVLGAFGLALMQQGLPPFPPISSKHKLIYLLQLVAMLAPLAPRLPPIGRVLALGALILGTILWLNWRRFGVGIPGEVIFLWGALALTLGLAMSQVDRADRPEFLWPTTLFVMVLAAGVVGLLSGYLGLGQLLGSLAAYFGGMLVLPFLGVVFAKEAPGSPSGSKRWRIPQAFSWAVLSIMAVLGVSLASFATNLDPRAFGMLLVVLLAPLVALKVPALSIKPLQPIVFAAIAAVPAGAAIALAALNF